MKVAIIGAGAAGLFAGGLIANKGHQVEIFDGNEKCGKKLYITGKGRCNFTNACDKETFLNNVVRGAKFFQSALSRFSPADTIDFFEKQGVKTKIERGGRAFPASDKSSDIIKALEKFAGGCSIRLGKKVKSLKSDDNGFLVDGEKFDRVIVATGGKSYSSTGSTGDGYKFALGFGHNVVDLVSALCPIRLDEKLGLEGISLKNVRLTCECEKQTFSKFGEMIFTDDGISGPIVLSLSSLINRQKVKELYLDFKPALSLQQLGERLVREFDSAKNKNLSSVMSLLLPKRLISKFLEKIGLDGSKKVNSITVKERNLLAQGLKHWTMKYKMLYSLDSGIVTSGGVDTKQINPKTMQSKLQNGLYFIGEVLDIDALTGGFNLQIAFSTAYAASEDF